MSWWAILAGAVAAPVVISYAVDRARPRPARPERLPWEPDTSIRYLDLHGVGLRYIVMGEGPPIVLLHTLRTQLDMFQHVVPELAKRF